MVLFLRGLAVYGNHLSTDGLGYFVISPVSNALPPGIPSNPIVDVPPGVELDAPCQRWTLPFSRRAVSNRPDLPPVAGGQHGSLPDRIVYPGQRLPSGMLHPPRVWMGTGFGHPRSPESSPFLSHVFRALTHLHNFGLSADDLVRTFSFAVPLQLISTRSICSAVAFISLV